MNDMRLYLTLALLFVLVACTLAQTSPKPKRKRPNGKGPEVDQKCMRCLCQACSDCDENMKCHNSGGDSYYCGPYVISRGYWEEAGRPGNKGQAHDFETCLTKMSCAEMTIRRYMRKYGQDCDQSGSIDCYDFTRLHKLGFGNCGGTAVEDTKYWKKFLSCYSEHQPPHNNTDTDNNENSDSPVHQ